MAVFITKTVTLFLLKFLQVSTFQSDCVPCKIQRCLLHVTRAACDWNKKNISEFHRLLIKAKSIWPIQYVDTEFINKMMKKKYHLDYSLTLNAVKRPYNRTARDHPPPSCWRGPLKFELSELRKFSLKAGSVLDRLRCSVLVYQYDSPYSNNKCT
jgi:hypothetical protein